MGTGERIPHESRGANTGQSCYQVNDSCHGWVGGVPRNDGHVMESPQVSVVYWDAYFQGEPGAVDLMNTFFTDILGGRFMRGLRQYGVGAGKLLGHQTIVPAQPPPASMSREDIENQLIEWIDQEVVPAPTPDERNLLYVIFTPNHTTFGDVGYCTCGYHQSGRYRLPTNDNLFWAAIQEWHHGDKLPADPRDFVDSCSWCVSHEMVEAFTNRDGRGYHTETGCEIGDICECAKGSPTQKTPIIKTAVDGWWVEPYWDNVNRSCYPLHIVPRSDAPVEGYEIEG